MKPYSNVKIIAGRVIPVLVYLANCGKLGRFGPNSPYHNTNTQKVIHSVVKLLISHQIDPCSSVKGHLRVNLYFFVSLWNCASWQNLAQLSQIRAEIHQKSSKVLNSTFHIK